MDIKDVKSLDDIREFWGRRGSTSSPAEQLQTVPTVDPNRAAALEEGHAAVDEAEDQASRRFGGMLAKRRLANAREAEAAILKELGFKNVRVYDSSWLGYGNTLDAPAENVTFFNVGMMNSRMSAMQKRIETLEKELAETKAAK